MYIFYTKYTIYLTCIKKKNRSMYLPIFNPVWSHDLAVWAPLSVSGCCREEKGASTTAESLRVTSRLPEFLVVV